VFRAIHWTVLYSTVFPTWLAAPLPTPQSGNSLEIAVGRSLVPEHKKATKWVSLPCVLVRSFAAVVKRLRRVADKQGPNLPPELPNWSRSAFFPVIESFPVYSQFFGECLLSEILPEPITRQRLRESLGVARERGRIQPYGPER
jgi:hypothetical protein